MRVIQQMLKACELLELKGVGLQSLEGTVQVIDYTRHWQFVSNRPTFNCKFLKYVRSTLLMDSQNNFFSDITLGNDRILIFEQEVCNLDLLQTSQR